jgi:ribosomal protein L7/L12
MSGSEEFPADVRAALQRGETIEAIKLLRHATGLGLKECKDAIDAYVAGHPPTLPLRPAAAQHGLPGLPASGEVPADVLAVLVRDGKIAAIKLLRERTGLGLKEAKDAIEAVPAARLPMTAAPAARTGPRRSTGMGIETPKGGGGLWLGLALAAAAVAVVLWHFLGRA